MGLSSLKDPSRQQLKNRGQNEHIYLFVGSIHNIRSYDLTDRFAKKNKLRTSQLDKHVVNERIRNG